MEWAPRTIWIVLFCTYPQSQVFWDQQHVFSGRMLIQLICWRRWNLAIYGSWSSQTPAVQRESRHLFLQFDHLLYLFRKTVPFLKKKRICCSLWQAIGSRFLEMNMSDVIHFPMFFWCTELVADPLGLLVKATSWRAQQQLPAALTKPIWGPSTLSARTVAWCWTPSYEARPQKPWKTWKKKAVGRRNTTKTRFCLIKTCVFFMGFGCLESKGNRLVCWFGDRLITISLFFFQKLQVKSCFLR